jgi:hypothetical protein
VTEWTKIDFRHRRVQAIDDITDLVAMLFPGNRNLQHAAARILIELRASDQLLPDMAHLEAEYDISRRTLQRARAKLNRMGLIERIGFLNRRHHGQAGWRLSKRFSSSMRRLAQTWDAWSENRDLARLRKDVALVETLR